jgi:hypothetical protein
MKERREYFATKDRGRYAVRYRYVVPGDTRPGNADNLPEFPAMAGVRFLTEGKALQAAAALQLAYADGIAAAEGGNGNA